MPWVKPRRSTYDNSDYQHKLDLRERYADKVGATLCLDLFCGTGTFASAVWAPRFERVICVDKQHKQLEQWTPPENVSTYQGDNAKLLTGLLVKYGAPDLVDLDAYGSPDALAKELIQTCLTSKPLAIIGTDGSMTVRTRGSMNAVPQSHGYGPGLSYAKFAIGMDGAAVRTFTLLRDWCAISHKRVADFDAYVWRYMMYWAALIVPEDVT